MADVEEIPQLVGDISQPGPWWKLTTAGNGGERVWLRTPCNHDMSLREHWILSSGLVEPAVQCVAPHCKFQAKVRLLSWRPETPSNYIHHP